MTKMVSISMQEYKEYLKLKQEKDAAVKHVNSNLEALKEGRVYDL